MLPHNQPHSHVVLIIFDTLYTKNYKAAFAFQLLHTALILSLCLYFEFLLFRVSQHCSYSSSFAFLLFGLKFHIIVRISFISLYLFGFMWDRCKTWIECF